MSPSNLHAQSASIDSEVLNLGQSSSPHILQKGVAHAAKGGGTCCKRGWHMLQKGVAHAAKGGGTCCKRGWHMLQKGVAHAAKGGGTCCKKGWLWIWFGKMGWCCKRGCMVLQTWKGVWCWKGVCLWNTGGLCVVSKWVQVSIVHGWTFNRVLQQLCKGQQGKDRKMMEVWQRCGAENCMQCDSIECLQNNDVTMTKNEHGKNGVQGHAMEATKNDWCIHSISVHSSVSTSP